MDWTGKKVLVTGSAGFVGSHLTEEMVRRGAKVRAFVQYNSRNNWGHIEALPDEIHSEIEVVAGDIRDGFFVDHAVAGQDVIFHLASLIAIPYSYVAPAAYIETNVTGALNVFQAARRHAVERVIHTSTSETYGTALYSPIDENHPLQAQSPYAASKIAADKLAESFQKSFDVPISTIRPFNIFGPRQSARAIVPTIISQALYGDNIKLGSLLPIRDLTYVSDTVAAFVRIAETPATIGQTINIGSGQAVSIGDLLEIILAQLDIRVPIQIVPERMRPERSEVLKLICDNSKAMKLIDWKPVVSLESGLGSVIDWMRTKRNLFKHDIYNI